MTEGIKEWPEVCFQPVLLEQLPSHEDARLYLLQYIFHHLLGQIQLHRLTLG